MTAQSVEIGDLYERENRIVSFVVTGADPLTANNGRVIVPDRASISYSRENGKPWRVDGATVHGHRRLSTGKTGRETSKREWWSPGDIENHLPAWLSQLVGRFHPSDGPADA